MKQINAFPLIMLLIVVVATGVMSFISAASNR